MGYPANKVVIFSGFGGFSVFRVLGSSLGLRVCFFDGFVTDCYNLNSSGLKLYADPGDYEVRYYLVDSAGLPADYQYVGNVTRYFMKNPIVKSITVKPNQTYTLSPPKVEEFLSELGRVTVCAPSNFGVVVNVSWGSGSKVFSINPRSSLRFYAVPGQYDIHVYLSPAAPLELIGSGAYFDEVLSVSSGSSEVVSLDESPLGAIGLLSLRDSSSIPVKVVIAWSSGSREVFLKPGGSAAFYATPGNYFVKVVPGIRVIGYSIESKREIYISASNQENINAELPVARICLASPGTGIAELFFSNGTLAWRGGGGDCTWVSAGNYVLGFRFSGSVPSDVVGDLGDYVVKVSLSVNSGVEYSFDAESRVLGSLSTLKIKGPAGASVRVSWPGGSKFFTIPASGVLELRAVPGTEYRVVVSAPDVFHSDFTSVVRVSEGSIGSVYVSFPFSLVFYGVVLGAVGAFGVSFYVFGVRPRVSVRLLTDEVVKDVVEFIEVEFRNSGLREASFRASVSVDGVEVFSGVVRVPGRSRRVVRVPLRFTEGDWGGVGE